MKISYSNSPCNRQKNSYPSLRIIAVMSCVIAMMVAIKVFYKPNESMADVAAMANATIESSHTEETELPEPQAEN